MPAASALETLLATYPSVLVAYSGGVDSALLAVVARRTLGRERALGAIGVSASFSRAQHEQAISLAAAFDLDLVELSTDELADPNYVANSPDRCYFCKRELWDELRALAAARDIPIIADGTNADDLHEHRPGLRAAREADIRSPLAEVGYTKARVREEARALGLPVWDAPASPCLSSRLAYGLAVTTERLGQVEAGEAFLRGIGVAGDLRVRHRGDEARIEVAPAEFRRLREARDRLADAFLGLGFVRVTLDLRGYRRGSLLDRIPGDVELLAGR